MNPLLVLITTSRQHHVGTLDLSFYLSRTNDFAVFISVYLQLLTSQFVGVTHVVNSSWTLYKLFFNMIVKVKQGSLEGKEETSVLTGKKLFSFMGIPYAQPPVGELRFRVSTNNITLCNKKIMHYALKEVTNFMIFFKAEPHTSVRFLFSTRVGFVIWNSPEWTWLFWKKTSWNSVVTLVDRFVIFKHELNHLLRAEWSRILDLWRSFRRKWTGPSKRTQLITVLCSLRHSLIGNRE